MRTKESKSIGHMTDQNPSTFAVHHQNTVHRSSSLRVTDTLTSNFHYKGLIANFVCEVFIPNLTFRSHKIGKTNKYSAAEGY